MKIAMVGFDFHRIPLAEREACAVSASRAAALLPRLRTAEGVDGCVLLATCNRTEFYLSGTADPAAVFCAAAGLGRLSAQAVVRTGEEAARNLFAVAAGLESQIYGDDQIITQVGNALRTARELKCTDAVLESVFGRAIAAGKRVKTATRLTAIPASAADCAVEKAAQYFGALRGRTAVVIGNGEMGRRTAALLQARGCRVTVTLRTYRHGETVVPAGCGTHPYDDRYAALEHADFAVSATASPHATLTKTAFAQLQNPPRLLIDLALPRDIEAEIASDEITVWNLDDLQNLEPVDPAERRTAEALLDEEFANLRAWYDYRQALPEIAALKEELAERVRHDPSYAEAAGEALLELAVGKTVDLLLGGMKDIVTAERLADCRSHVKKGSGR